MDRPDAGTFAGVARLLDAQPDLTTTLDRIVELAKETIDCDFAAVTLRHGGGRVETPAATDKVVEQADALQYEVGEGPCLQAIWSHETFVCNDLARDERWPQWGPSASALGLGSLLAVRLFTDEDTHGALNLYADNERCFDDDDVAVAHVFAAHAALALASARQEQHLQRAIDARHLIGQAQGILMERFDIEAERAFEVLRRYSQERNVKLRVIAEEVIAGRTRLEEGEDGASA